MGVRLFMGKASPAPDPVTHVAVNGHRQRFQSLETPSAGP
jgi:hypothetical protein